MAESHVVSGVSTNEVVEKPPQEGDNTLDQQETIKESFGMCRQLIASTFPRCKYLPSDLPVQATTFQHKNHLWFATFPIMVSSLVAQKHFVARPTDVFVASAPKTGTTWLKGLVSTISTRGNKEQQQQSNVLPPHQQIPFLEFQVYASEDHLLDIESLPSPRLLSTHIPYASLPVSMIDSRCPIAYIWRDPKAKLVSEWHFFNKIDSIEGSTPVPIEEKFQWFCEGFSLFGPYWDHVLGYWNAKKNGGNILFLNYEDMMEDPGVHIKTLAEFMGVPFTEQEEKEGVMEGIITACSFEKMRDSKVNKSGKTKMLNLEVVNSSYFREGKANDWANYLTPEMAERLDLISKEKFADTDLI